VALVAAARVADGRGLLVKDNGRMHPVAVAQSRRSRAVRNGRDDGGMTEHPLRGSRREQADDLATREALQEREARLRSILETAPDAIIVIDECGIMESYSPAAQRLFG